MTTSRREVMLQGAVIGAGIIAANMTGMEAWAQGVPPAPSVAGTWAYRSYINTSDQPVFGAGLFTFQTPTATTLTGTFDMGSDLVLDLKGIITPANGDSPLTVDIRGFGRANTGTDGWEYDYHGFDAFHWPAGVNQVQSLVGSVLRAKPHDGGPAGVTASFIAVRQS